MTAAVPPAPRPAALDRRQFVLGGTLLAAAGAAVALRPQRVAQPLSPGMLERAIPKRIGPYEFVTASGLVLPPSDEITERIYDQVLTRVYAADALMPVMLLIAYGSAQDYTLQAHLPEVCYPASGYTVTGLDRVETNIRPGVTDTATTLTAERPDRVEQIFYWVRIGDRFPSTLSGERMAVVAANLAGTLPDGVLVRLSTLSPDATAALPELGTFNTLLMRSLGPAGRRLLAGATRS